MENPTGSAQCSEALHHRLWIAGRVATLLSHYWRADDPPEILEANMRDWCDILEHLPQAAIQQAAIRWLAGSCGRKPTPGEIAALARDALPAPKVVRIAPPAEPDKPRLSFEAAQEIVRTAGFRPLKFGGADASD